MGFRVEESARRTGIHRNCPFESDREINLIFVWKILVIHHKLPALGGILQTIINLGKDVCIQIVLALGGKLQAITRTSFVHRPVKIKIRSPYEKLYFLILVDCLSQRKGIKDVAFLGY